MIDDGITYVREIPSCIAGAMFFVCLFWAAGFAIMAILGEWFRQNH